MIDLTWLSFIAGLTILALIYVRVLGTGAEDKQP